MDQQTLAVTTIKIDKNTVVTSEDFLTKLSTCYLKRVKRELEQTMKKLKPERISIGWRIRGL